jgi:hypothetical protein
MPEASLQLKDLIFETTDSFHGTKYYVAFSRFKFNVDSRKINHFWTFISNDPV